MLNFATDFSKLGHYWTLSSSVIKVAIVGWWLTISVFKGSASYTVLDVDWLSLSSYSDSLHCSNLVAARRRKHRVILS